LLAVVSIRIDVADEGVWRKKNRVGFTKFKTDGTSATNLIKHQRGEVAQLVPEHVLSDKIVGKSHALPKCLKWAFHDNDRWKTASRTSRGFSEWIALPMGPEKLTRRIPAIHRVGLNPAVNVTVTLQI
jgi:hypothetical protein